MTCGIYKITSPSGRVYVGHTGAVLRKAKSREYAADGYSQGNISSCCNGRLKTHKGFKFRHEEQAQ